jgi:lysophospholipase L1-like esterase
VALVASALEVEVLSKRIQPRDADRALSRGSWLWNDTPKELEPCLDKRCFSYTLEELAAYREENGLSNGQLGKLCTDECARQIGGGDLHAEADILLIGDSEAQLSLNYLEQVCKNKKVNNLGISGSTALQWSQNERGGLCAGSSIGACSAAEAFSPKHGKGYTHLWISLGGNDFLESTCTMPEEELQHRMNEVVRSARAAAGPAVTIVMMGYPIPTARVTESYCPGYKPSDRMVTREAKNACATDLNCRFVETAFVDGAGSYDEFSSGHLHADEIHLNAQGYCALFTMKEVQEAFQCEPAEYSC